MTKDFAKNLTNEFGKSLKRKLSSTRIRAIALSILFIVSGIGASVLMSPAAATPNAATPSAAAPVAAQSALTQAEANWAFPNGNSFAQDYNPQNQINSSNIQYLGLAWIYPLPTLPTSLNSLIALGTSGIGIDPLIINGTAIAMTQFDEVFDFNIANGDVLWTFTSPLAVNQTQGEASGPVESTDTTAPRRTPLRASGAE